MKCICCMHVIRFVTVSLVCFALVGFIFEHCHLEFAHFFRWWLSILFSSSSPSTPFVILSLLHSTLIRLMSRYAYKRLIYTSTRALPWYKSNSTYSNHHWNEVWQKKRERERESEWKNLLICASGHAWKRDKCVVRT